MNIQYRWAGYNLDSSQTWGLSMNFLNHREGFSGFLPGFPPFSFTVYRNWTIEIRKRLLEFEEMHKRLHEFEEILISRQSCRGENQGGHLLFGFRPRIRPLDKKLMVRRSKKSNGDGRGRGIFSPFLQDGTANYVKEQWIKAIPTKWWWIEERLTSELF